jgi:ABC-type transport system involved in multi-copper enzyme maturation permease subunit
MTATAVQVPHTGGAGGLRLIRAEYLKIRTTHTWWIFTIVIVVLTLLSLAYNILMAYALLHSEGPASAGDGGDAGGPGGAAAMQASYDLQHSVVTQAANVFTSGQYFGGLFVMLLAILLITNEYHHQTATTTFLTTPHRTAVIGAKFATAMIAAAGFWLLTTVLSLIGGIIYFKVDGFDPHLGDWEIQHAILVNLMVFALWGVFGIGFGVLLRNQLAATITASVLYVAGGLVIGTLFKLVYFLWIKEDWVLTLQVIVPASAAEVATAATKAYPQAAPWWVGVLVLLGYGIVTGVIGTLIMRRRDIT